MDPKPQKPSFLFANPLVVWTEYALKLWGFGKPPATEKEVTVAVIPTRDAQSPPQQAQAARASTSPKRTKGKARGKNKSKRARR
jgi:hypothetical protein